MDGFRFDLVDIDRLMYSDSNGGSVVHYSKRAIARFGCFIVLLTIQELYSFVSSWRFYSWFQKSDWSSGSSSFVRTKNGRFGGIFDGDREEAAGEFSFYRPF